MHVRRAVAVVVIGLSASGCVLLSRGRGFHGVHGGHGLRGGHVIGHAVRAAVGCLFLCGETVEDGPPPQVVDYAGPQHLIGEARESARAGDCTTVQLIAAEEHDSYAEFYAKVFVHDPEIMRACVAAIREGEATNWRAARLRGRRELEARRAGFLAAERAAAPHDTPPAADPDLPDRLDPSMIRTAIANIASAVATCEEQRPVAGTVVVAIEVGADGAVVAATVVRTPDAELGACVAAAARTATFAATRSGGRFRYPFLF